MKFNKQTNEKQRLLELIHRSHQNKNLELEALVYYQGIQKLIQYDDFVACLKRIKNQNEFKMYPPNEVLNITFRIDSKYKYIRVSIYGKETIKFFCAHGRIKDLGNNVKYFHKENISDENGKPSRVNMDDYYLRFNLKEERPLDETNELVRDLLEHWQETPKYFRYKKIFTFETIDGLFRNDLSIVKESKTEDKELTVAEVIKNNLEDLVIKPEKTGNFKEWWNKIKNTPNNIVKVSNQKVYYQSFQKSGTLDNTSNYEIEVEYLGNQKGQKTLSDNDVMIKFIQLIGIHLQAIQKSYYVIGRNEIGQVRNTFANLTGVRGRNLFKASLPNTVELSNIQQLTNRQYLDTSNHTLRKNFLVTEKADGERNLLYIDHVGEFYFINRQNLVRKIGIKMPEIANTLVDGEYLEDQKLYMIFDAYFFQQKPVWKEVFDPRYEAVKQISEYIKINVNKPFSQVEVKFPLIVGRKIYYRGDNILKKEELEKSDYDTLIFDACKKILNQVNVEQGGKLEIGHQFSYNVDGLIFIPADLHVGQDYHNHQVKHFNDTSAWARTYKWKPPHLNSIDFEIEVFKPSGKSEPNDQYYNGILYRQVILKVNYQSNFHDRYNSQRTLNEGGGLFNGSKPFIPNYPFVGSRDYNNNLVEETHIAWLPIDNNNNMVSMDGIIVQNGDVVEFSYNINEPNPQHRWKPLKGRPGKKPNGYHTAINIWRSIHEPITTNMIIGETKIPKVDSYYQLNVNRDELYLKEMNKFHNFIKGRLFDHIGKNFKHPYILDLACGKFGDYFKYANIKPGLLVGVDYSQDNINNFNDGACVRALMAAEENHLLKKMNHHVIAISGDCHLPLNTAEAGMDELNKYYLNVLYGDVDLSDYSKLGKLSGKALRKFDIVSCQFAIHYFFGTYDRLTGFLNNVHQNTKTNGYFIGTCLDGKSIFNKFKNEKKDVLEQVQDGDKSKLIWRIKKDYDEDDSKFSFTNDEKSLGMKIEVEVESINNTSYEYLVNFEYLTKLLNDYGFELVDSRLFHEVPNSMLEEFYAEVPSHGANLKKKQKSLEYSVLHRWFIFVKKGLSETDGDGLTQEEEREITSSYSSEMNSQTDLDSIENKNESNVNLNKKEKIKDDILVENLDLESIKI